MSTGNNMEKEGGEQSPEADSPSTDFYQKLRRRINEWSRKHHEGRFPWAEWLMTAPDLFHLLLRLSTDPRVEWKHKVRVAAVMAYFISPLDFLPEMILGPTAYLDDIVLAAMVLNGLINESDPEVVRELWAGEGDILRTVQIILSRADRMLGKGLVRRLGRWLNHRS